MRTLLVTVHSEDPELTEELLAIVPTDPPVSLADDSSAEVLGHQHVDAPDVVFVDAGPPPPASLPRELRDVYPSSFVVLVSKDVDEEALALGAEIEADAYLRRDRDVVDTARLLIAAAGVASRGAG